MLPSTDAASRFRRESPAIQSDQRPDGFDDAEWPRSLEESVDGTENACARESQDEPVAAFFERVKNHHRRYSNKSESGENGHVEINA
jgi:hypothetical protein